MVEHALLLLAIVLIGVQSRIACADASRPNIVLIMADVIAAVGELRKS